MDNVGQSTHLHLPFACHHLCSSLTDQYGGLHHDQKHLMNLQTS